MALQKKERKIFLASTSRHRDVGGNYCRYAGRLRQSSRCQKSLNCSYTRAKTVSWQESSRNWTILWGDRSLPGGKGAAGRRREMEEQQPASITPPTPISLKRIGINSSLPLPGDPEIRSKGKAFRHRPPPGNRAWGRRPPWHRPAGNPARPAGRRPARRAPSHTDPRTHTHPSRCGAPGPAARTHPAASEPRHGDAAVPPRGRPPLPLRRRGAISAASVSRVVSPARPRRSPQRWRRRENVLEKGWNTTKNREVWEKPAPRGKEEVRGRGCPAEGGCGEEQGLRKPRAGPWSPGVRPAGLPGTLCSPPESQPVLEFFTGKFGPALRRKEFVNVAKDTLE